MNIAILGGGNGSYAAVADLSEQGHSIRFWRRDGAALDALQVRQTLTLKDYRGEREINIDIISPEIKTVLEQAALIIIPTPAFAQHDIAQIIAPHLKADQVVFLPPGTFGSYLMYKTLRQCGCMADIAIAETGTLPYLTRKHGAATIAITTRATRLPTGVFPARLSEHALATVKAAYPAIEPVEDSLSAALMNAGPVIHPPLIIMNAGPIEHFEHWDIHNEGTQPAIRRVTDHLDAERIAIRKTLRYAAPHFPLADHYNAGGDEWMYGNLAHDKLVDSGDWRETIDLHQHRYMREDIAFGLAFLVSVGNWSGAPCPVASSLLALGSAIVGEDFRARGRTLENLGLAGLNQEQMKRLLFAGVS